MPKYYVCIDRLTGTVKGHTFDSTMYKPNDIEDVVIHNDEWPHDESGEIVANRNYKFDGGRVRIKTQIEIEESRKIK